MTKTSQPKTRTQGMNWIRKEKRLAIYLRDGMACAYCGSSVEEGTQLTLDHIKPYSKGGSNDPSNLVTCCQKCNSARGNRAMKPFAEAVAKYIDTPAAEVLKHVNNTRKRVIDVNAAKALIAKRGSWAAALNG